MGWKETKKPEFIYAKFCRRKLVTYLEISSIYSVVPVPVMQIGIFANLDPDPLNKHFKKFKQKTSLPAPMLPVLL